MRNQAPAIEAVNVDLLFRFSTPMPPPAGPAAPSTAAPSRAVRQEVGDGMRAAPAPAAAPRVIAREQLMFVGEKRVEVVNEGDWRVISALVPGPGEVLLQALASVVSSGTELKVFRGQFDEGAQLDTTITSMKDAAMAYPLQYGYSFVGKVVRVGPGVDEAAWMVRSQRAICVCLP